MISSSTPKPSKKHQKVCICDDCKSVDEQEKVPKEEEPQVIETENDESSTLSSEDSSKVSTLTEKDISLEEFDHLPKSLQNRLGALKLLKEKGNDLYRRNLFEEAVEEYSKVDRFMGVLFKKSE